MRAASRFATLLSIVAGWIGVAFSQPHAAATSASRAHLVMVIAEDEYRTAETLPAFAADELGDEFRLTTVQPAAGKADGIPGLESVADIDVLLVSVRRRPLPAPQLDRIRTHISAGRPVVGIRTANHAFHLRQGEPSAGLVQWPTFDADVFGGNYTNHLDNALRTTARGAPGAQHPILQGLPAGEFATGGSLYVVAPLAASATELLRGRAAGVEGEQPVAWVNRRGDGGWSFYTSLGHPDDFARPEFRRLLANAIRWAARQPVPEAAATVPPSPNR